MLASVHRMGFGPRRFLDEMRQELSTGSYERIGVAPVGATIGAEISGVDLREPLDDETFAEIQRAHLEFKVVFFRDQDLSSEQHLAFARRFGELEEHPFLPSADGEVEVVRFAKDADTVGVENIWHSDVSWREVPALGSVLRAREVPPIGGDTLWADMVAAYEGLSDAVKERIEGLRAVHDFTYSFGMGMPKERLAEMQEKFPPVEHPVVRTHPQTGRRILYVNGIFTSHIVGMEHEESNELLDFLCRQATIPEYQCRFHWQKNSIAFWDNRSAQHYAVNDYWPQERVMERVTIIGDRPF
ncbi:MAG: taurine dioxygenase [Myxococcota bacterium]